MSATQKWAAGLWAVAVAITVELLFPVFWWHPYCSRPHNYDALGYPGIGFPFPYAQFSGFLTSVMPHVYIANVIVLSAVLFLIFRALLGNRGAVLSRFALALGGAAFLLAAALQAIFALTAVVPPGISIASNPDSYFSYRPEFIALHGSNRPCVRVLKVREADEPTGS